MSAERAGRARQFSCGGRDRGTIPESDNRCAAIDSRDGKLFVNPGECCRWATGRATVATIDLETTEVELIEVPT